MTPFISCSKSIKIFKLYTSVYTLKSKNKSLFPHSLEGCLLAFDFGSDLIGYSDFLPWPAFGEKTLFHQLNEIKQGVFSNRFFIAKQNALLDAQARSQKRNIFFGLKIPPSHFLIADLLNFNKLESILEKGFKTIKVKLKPYEINKQIEKLKILHFNLKNILWRLDLNGTSWALWKNKLCFLKNHIDFIEDPCSDKGSREEKNQNLFAQDWLNSPHYQIKIVKPSRDRLDLLIKELAFFRWKRLVFTHSFDHPLGQVASAFWAGVFYKNYNCFFETGAFRHFLLPGENSYPLNQSRGPGFSPPSGFGFGFSDSLKKEKWKRWL